MQSSSFLILAINPGSTSTKVALFKNSRIIAQENIQHESKIISSFAGLWEQFDFRINSINAFLRKNAEKFEKLSAVVGRGGLLKPLSRGTYLVDDAMIDDARKGIQGEHVSNLGCALADEIARRYNCPAYVVDPVSVDEFNPLARYSGHPLILRRSLSHALNLRASAIWAAEKIGKKIDRCNFVVAHLGGGISVAPVQGGKVIDVNDASSDGPFSPERTGGLPLKPFIELCFSGQYDQQQMKRMVMGEGGLEAYLGTSDVREIESRIEKGDDKALEVFNAMAYQIAKEIAAMASVLCGQVDGIVLSGGLANSKRLMAEIKKRIDFIASIFIFAGELEMEAMAAGVLRVLRGDEKLKNY
ncbi:MAG: butyrate kinase [Actinobacteria bacterium]|nr:butyrate kinase [Actinomycetota bacterium]